MTRPLAAAAALRAWPRGGPRAVVPPWGAASLAPIAACGRCWASGRAAPAARFPGPRAAAVRRSANPLFAAAAQLRATHPAEAAELQMVAETPAGIWAAGQPGDIQVVPRVARTAARIVPFR